MLLWRKGMNRIILLGILVFLCSLVSIFSSGRKSLEALNDEFEDPNLMDQWTRVELAEGYPDRMGEWDINETMESCLYIKPLEGMWYRGYQGTYLYKEIKGDFAVTTRLMIQGAVEDFPDRELHNWQIAGVMLRVAPNLNLPPDEREENWVFNTYGLGIGRKYLIDIGTVKESLYSCYPHTGVAGWVDLRIVRVGEKVIFLSKNDGEDWVLREAIFREDFPHKLQVGLMTNSSGFNYPFYGLVDMDEYSFDQYNRQQITAPQSPDLRAYFDYIHFMSVQIREEELESIWLDRDALLQRILESTGD